MPRKKKVKDEAPPVKELETITEEDVGTIEDLQEPVEPEEVAVEVVEEAPQEPVVPEEATVEEPVVEKPQPMPDDVVTVQVLIGSLGFRGTVYSAGDLFETTREIAESISKGDIKILE